MTLGVIAQSDPGDTNLTTIYTVPASTEAIISSFFVVNRGASDTWFSLKVAINGAGDDDKQFIYYQEALKVKRTWKTTGGLTLAAGDVLKVQFGATGCNINVFGETRSTA